MSRTEDMFSSTLRPVQAGFKTMNLLKYGYLFDHDTCRPFHPTALQSVLPSLFVPLSRSILPPLASFFSPVFDVSSDDNNKRHIVLIRITVKLAIVIAFGCGCPFLFFLVYRCLVCPPYISALSHIAATKNVF